jgi:hypothetical protein
MRGDGILAAVFEFGRGFFGCFDEYGSVLVDWVLFNDRLLILL